MYEHDLAFNNLKGLICDKTQLTWNGVRATLTNYMKFPNEYTPTKYSLHQRSRSKSRSVVANVLYFDIVIIIIMSCRRHGYPWPSLATSPYHSSLLAGLPGYIPYPHIAVVCMFELVVLLLLGHMRGSIGVHR